MPLVSLDATGNAIRCSAISGSGERSVKEQTHKSTAELLSGDVPALLLGYYNEDIGAHYVSLKPVSTQCLHDIQLCVYLLISRLLLIYLMLLKVHRIMSSWPADDISKAPYGDEELMELAITVKLEVMIFQNL